MSAPLEFHWPGTAQATLPATPPADPAAVSHAPPPRPDVDAVLTRLLEARPAALVALANKAECERRLHAALDRVRTVEAGLSATRAKLDDARSLVQTQQLHIDALSAELRRSQSKEAAVLSAPTLGRVLASVDAAVRAHVAERQLDGRPVIAVG